MKNDEFVEKISITNDTEHDEFAEEVSIVSYDISVIPNDFNVITIISLLESSVISMPVFQRNYTWDKKRASRFIESLILGLPIPQIFLYQQERNKYSVIDGQQRLMSIYFFTKQRFPRSGQRVMLRKIFDAKGHIPDEILSNDTYFENFKLKFANQENGDPHPLNDKTYATLTDDQKSAFELMTIRCMSIRQNNTNDDTAIYEIFSRLNTGGINLSPQEIRGCLYYSPFYQMLYDLNSDKRWRTIYGKDTEDDKFKDVEVLLRSFALLAQGDSYSGNMASFLNRFSKTAGSFTQEKIEQFRDIFKIFLGECSSIDTQLFRGKNNSFNTLLFESVFVVVSKELLSNNDPKISIDSASLMNLKEDKSFSELITHSTSHANSVQQRIDLAQKYLIKS